MALTLTGWFSTRIRSRPTGPDVVPALPVWALFALGFAVALLHTTFDYSLGLPGHHGFELMTALMFSRLVSPQRWACLMVASGTVGGDLLLATDLMHNLKHVPLYFVAGGGIDLLYRVLGEHCRRPGYAALAGGMLHVSKPLLMLLMAALADASFGFMRFGAVFPLVTHFAFGAIGAICGALLARGYLHEPERARRRPS